MTELNRVWTTVGSAGLLNQADLAKVNLFQSTIQLGTEIAPPIAEAALAKSQLARPFPTVQAVARYNVVAVDGLFFQPGGSAPFSYGLRLRYLGHVTANLKEVDLATGVETTIVSFDSTNFPAASAFQAQTAFATSFNGVLDFSKKACYVEATLIAPALIIGHAAAISTIELFAKRPDF